MINNKNYNIKKHNELYILYKITWDFLGQPSCIQMNRQTNRPKQYAPDHLNMGWGGDKGPKETG